MDTALTLLAVVVTVLAGTALASRVGAPAPLVLIVVGIAGSYVPGVPQVTLSPELVLLGLLPPLLYSAAITTSLVDFRRLRGPILSLAVGLVLFTALGVGLVAWWVLPIPFAVAVALGAVVAPPDAVAAVAVGRRIGLPRQVVTVLEGESLLNDATALVTLRTAIAAFTSAGVVTAGSVALDFVWAVVGGVGSGLVVAAVIAAARKRVTVPTADTALSFVAPFAAYLPAEGMHASGVLAVVTTGLVLGHKAPVLQTASSRLAERTNWASVQFLLENAVFLLIGLQARAVTTAAASSELGGPTVLAGIGAVLAAVILLRPVWGMASQRVRALRPGDAFQDWREGAVVSWAGMRGVVTLAAAFVLPVDTPHRDVLVLIALVVAVTTLLLQGTTLPWVARVLGVRGPDPREDALQEAVVTQQAVQAGLAALEDVPDADPDALATLRQRASDRVNRVWERLGPDEDTAATPSEQYRRLRLVSLTAEREELLAVRRSGSVDHEVLAVVLAALDVEESMLERVQERDRTLRDAPVLAPGGPGGDCEHLREAGCVAVPATQRTCPRCVEEGLTPVHLRLCLACGFVGCCDSSTGRHAREHHARTGHPVIRSFEAGEAWRWCFVDEILG